MTAIRAALIWGLIGGLAAARRQGQVSAVDVCVAAVQTLPVTGAWVMVQGAAGVNHVMCVTDETSEQLAELQVTLGEGPCPDVLASGLPVLISDLDGGDAARRWPGFTPQARQVNAAAIFVLPLRIGAIRAGTLGLYRDKPQPLSNGWLGDALILADAATVILLESQRTGRTASGRGCKTMKGRAWSAFAPASSSPHPTWRPPSRPGRGSPPLPGKQASRGCTPCRCACARKSSAA